MLRSKQLLQACKEHTRMTYADIAEKVGKSRTLVGMQLHDEHDLTFTMFEMYVNAMGFKIELVRDRIE